MESSYKRKIIAKISCCKIWVEFKIAHREVQTTFKICLKDFLRNHSFKKWRSWGVGQLKSLGNNLLKAHGLTVAYVDVGCGLIFKGYAIWAVTTFCSPGDVPFGYYFVVIGLIFAQRDYSDCVDFIKSRKGGWTMKYIRKKYIYMTTPFRTIYKVCVKFSNLAIPNIGLVGSILYNSVIIIWIV